MVLPASLLRRAQQSPWVRLVVAAGAVIGAVAAASTVVAALTSKPVVIMTAGVVSWPAYLAYVRVMERRRAAALLWIARRRGHWRPRRAHTRVA